MVLRLSRRSGRLFAAVRGFNGGAFGSPRINWDGHENIVRNHSGFAAETDRPIAALLTDLEQRGLLDETLDISVFARVVDVLDPDLASPQARLAADLSGRRRACRTTRRSHA